MHVPQSNYQFLSLLLLLAESNYQVSFYFFYLNETNQLTLALSRCGSFSHYTLAYAGEVKGECLFIGNSKLVMQLEGLLLSYLTPNLIACFSCPQFKEVSHLI